MTAASFAAPDSTTPLGLRADIDRMPRIRKPLFRMSGYHHPGGTERPQ